MIKKSLLASSLVLALSHGAFADNACTQPNGKDPLIGAWYGSFTVDGYEGFVGYGTVTFHADGTAVAGDTTGTGALGNLATPPTGIWKKIGPNLYQVTAITIYSPASSLPGTTSPAYTYRERGKVKLSDDCTQFTTVDDSYALYLPSDTDFAHPLLIGTLHQTFTRLKF